MKRKIILFISSVIIVAAISSCNNTFEPKTNFLDAYILNCVIRTDTTFQIATISSSYMVDGLNPLENTKDPFIGGAKITLTCSNLLGTEVYQFRDTIMERDDNARYSSPLHYYYLDKFDPSIAREQVNPGVYSYLSYQMKIEAVLPDGYKLAAYANSLNISPATVKQYKKNYPVITQEGNLLFGLFYNSFSLPELIIHYAKLENGNWIEYQKTIPKYYTTGKNPGIPVYPIIENEKDHVDYDTTAVRKTLEDISSGDPNKQNYLIKNIMFYLNIPNASFSRYLAAQLTLKNEFSVRTTQPDYNNVNGGGGIFGSMFTIKKEIPLTKMIKSIGYRTE